MQAPPSDQSNAANLVPLVVDESTENGVANFPLLRDLNNTDLMPVTVSASTSIDPILPPEETQEIILTKRLQALYDQLNEEYDFIKNKHLEIQGAENLKESFKAACLNLELVKNNRKIRNKALEITNNVILTPIQEELTFEINFSRHRLAREYSKAIRKLEESVSKKQLKESSRYLKDNRFTGYPKITLSTDGKLDIAYISQSAFDKEKKNKNVLYNDIFIVDKAVLDLKLNSTPEDFLSKVFSNLKSHFPQESILSIGKCIQKSFFTKQLLSLLGFYVSCVTFRPKPHHNEPKFQDKGWTQHVCCIVKINNSSFALDYEFDSIVNFDQYEYNNEDLFYVGNDNYRHLALNNKYIADLREEIELNEIIQAILNDDELIDKPPTGIKG